MVPATMTQNSVKLTGRRTIVCLKTSSPTRPSTDDTWASRPRNRSSKPRRSMAQ